MRSTRLSDQITLVLRQTHKPLSAYDIADLLTNETGRKHFSNSVYRVLRVLHDKGEVLKVISVNGWLLRDANLVTPVLLAICNQCDATEQIQMAEIDSTIEAISELNDFRKGKLHLEISGLCSGCACIDGGLSDVSKRRSPCQEAAAANNRDDGAVEVRFQAHSFAPSNY
jgi:Fur family zinc uptake transcriptional regulator